jgi:hypothetical protein
VDSHPECRPDRRRLRRGRATVTLALWATGLVVAGVLPESGATAAAAPPRCEDGSPPPCDQPEPDPDPDPDPDPHPNPNAPWTSLVSVLDQSEAGFDESVRGAWVSTGSPVYTTPSGTVQWNGPDHDQGSISISSTNLPSAPLMGFQLWEQDQDVDGSLCRSTPVGGVDPVLATTHVLVGESKTTTPDELTEMAGGFVGDASIPESQSGTYSADIQLEEVLIHPEPGASETESGFLSLTINGHLFVDGPGPFNVEGDFRYTGQVHLHPSEKAEVDQVVSATVSNDSLVIFGEDEDIEADLLPPFRKAVRDKVAKAVDDRVAATPEVQWFASLGFTVSFRDVTIDNDGIHVLPSLCKVG